MLKKILSWCGVGTFVIFALAAFSLGGFISGIILLLLAFICSPYRYLLLDRLPGKFRKSIVVVAASVVLFFASFLGIPTDSSEPVQEVAEDVVYSEISKDLAKVEDKETNIKENDISADTDQVKDTLEKEKAPEEKEAQTEVKTETTTKKEEVKETTKEPASTTDAKQFEITQDTAETATKEIPSDNTASESTSVTTTTNNTSSSQGGSGGNASNFSTGTATESGLYYIVNATNGKVHTSYCKRLPENDNQIIFHSLQEVQAAGYNDPCKLCNPW